MHRDLYIIGHKLQKRDKLGIHRSVEEIALKLLTFLIEAAFEKREVKIRTLESARILCALLKNIFRTEHELKVVDARTYVRVSKDMVEISKMISGWISYLNAKGV